MPAIITVYTAQDYTQVALLSDWQARRADGGADWTCPRCGEQSEGQFSACWNCLREKSQP